MSTRVARLALLPFVALLLLAACGGAGAPSPMPADDTSDIIPILATTVLRVGTQRVAFLLESRTGLVTTPQVEVTAVSPEGVAPGPARTADFHPWPLGTRGAYVTEIEFLTAGRWELQITVGGPERQTVRLPVDVTERSPTRDLGELAPFSASKTLADAGGDLRTITSHPAPDPDLYRLSIAESLITGVPAVIVFASPAFCTTPTCGPQVDTVIELKERYRDRANFIHVEVYDNPAEIQGDLSNARLSPVLSEWGLDQVPGYVNESWVFVLGRDGRITARFEGYATLRELEDALLAT